MNGGDGGDGFVPSEAEASDAAGPRVIVASGGLSWTRVAVPRLLSRIAKVCFLLGTLSAFAVLTDPFAMFAVAGLVSGLAWPLWIVSYILSLTQNSFAGAIAVSSSELVVHAGSKRTSFPVAKISGALVVERQVFSAFVPTVEIELTNGDVLTARLPDPGSAQAVVQKLGFGPGGRRVHARLAKPSRRLLHPLLGFVAYIASMVVMLGPLSSIGSRGDVTYALSPFCSLSIYALLVWLVRAPEVTVGDDGVLVRKKRRRFIPRSDVVGVTSSPRALAIRLRSGAAVALGGLLVDGARRTAVGRVLEQRFGPATAGADRFAHYDRGGRALAEWREHLARGMNESTYRQNAATVDEAAAVLHSAHATPEQRIGAAIALRVAGQPQERIRIAVDGAADERMRDALAAVAEANDADGDVVIEKALRRLQSP